MPGSRRSRRNAASTGSQCNGQDAEAAPHKKSSQPRRESSRRVSRHNIGSPTGGLCLSPSKPGGEMSFATWWKVVVATPTIDARIEARSRNLASEDRHVMASEFRAAVARSFEGSGATGFDEAVAALKAHTDGLFDVSSSYLGLKPTGSGPHKAWKPVTFVTANHIYAKLDDNFDPNAAVLAPSVRLPTPLYAAHPKPFVWTSNDDVVGGLSPTDIALSLGLPHFLPNDAVYKIELPDWPDEIFIPTCFDAGLYEAWAIPPRSHKEPWGLTRHLISGDLVHPEVLIPLPHIENQDLVARLVSVAGQDRIDDYSPDFLRRRTRRGYPK